MTTPVKTSARTVAPASPERLTRLVATERGLVPRGHVWDEGSQQAIPLGLAVRDDAIERGENLEQRLDRTKRDRAVILRFIGEQLVESEYDAKGRPVKGKMHDYYTLPGYSLKCPTKQGAEKVAQFFNLRRAKTESVDRVCTKEFAMAAVRVELVDKWGMPAGSGEAAATTAETAFQFAAKKYGGDWRAAFNDVLARAGKRAFVQAIVYATATDDIFDATGAVEQAAAAAGLDDESTPAAAFRFPDNWKSVAGKTLEEVSSEHLARIAKWCREKAENRDAAAPIAQAIDEELDRRRGDADPGPEL
jgi:hypothetical protein